MGDKIESRRRLPLSVSYTFPAFASINLYP